MHISVTAVTAIIILGKAGSNFHNWCVGV